MKDKMVRDWMHRGVITCRPETPVADVAETMERNDISALIVIGDAGDTLGVISRTDLVNARFIQPYMKYWRGLNAEHLMSKPVISVTADTTIQRRCSCSTRSTFIVWWSSRSSATMFGPWAFSR